MSEILPEFYAITAPLAVDDQAGSILGSDAMRTWQERFKALLATEVKLVQLRIKHLGVEHLEEIAGMCVKLASVHDVRLILNGPADMVSRFGFAGVHLTTAALQQSKHRPLSSEFLVGASCHSPEELQRAQRLDCDFACLSPVKITKAYEPKDVLGLEKFSEWVGQCSIPVYGLGGLEKADLEAVRAAGGQGIAGISAFWGD